MVSLFDLATRHFDADSPPPARRRVDPSSPEALSLNGRSSPWQRSRYQARGRDFTVSAWTNKRAPSRASHTAGGGSQDQAGFCEQLDLHSDQFAVLNMRRIS